MNIDIQNALISEALGLHAVTTDKKSWNNRGPLLLENVTVITDKNDKKMYLWTEFTRASIADNDFIYPKRYTENLDDMHIAEKFLLNRDGICYAYWEYLCEACAVSPKSNVTWWAAFATAEQRAEAFLRTIGKWKSA